MYSRLRLSQILCTGSLVVAFFATAAATRLVASLNTALYLVSYSGSTCFALSLATLACLEDRRDHFLDSEITDVMAVVLPAPDEEVVVVVAVVMVTRKMFPEEALLSIISITAPIFLSSALLISLLKVTFPRLPRKP